MVSSLPSNERPSWFLRRPGTALIIARRPQHVRGWIVDGAEDVMGVAGAGVVLMVDRVWLCDRRSDEENEGDWSMESPRLLLLLPLHTTLLKR